ncbi:MAG TPA: type II toxin-antitoxin system RelE/ParE family toxin [Candidatus Saccharimonadia bacterium]|jgi:toxin ParE1/3/4|nr:type II toxin-antitoxin system RelE/ParE family toxin [Candidatus Saccharimonadia bacterium]
MERPQPLYRLTRQAAADLRDIYRYTRRRWGKAQAERYTGQLQQCLTMLAVRPSTGRKREELQPPDLHSFVQGSHVMFYQPQPYGVLIVRILHGTQDARRHLGTEDTP